MPTREEIREGIAKIVDSGMSIGEIVDGILKYLHSQGGCLKVARKKIEGCDIIPKTNAICPYKEDCYALTEPLIEEE